jgi:hypothetical protein
VINLLTLDIRDYYSENEIKTLQAECTVCKINGIGFCQIHAPLYGWNSPQKRDSVIEGECTDITNQRALPELENDK